MKTFDNVFKDFMALSSKQKNYFILQLKVYIKDKYYTNQEFLDYISDYLLIQKGESNE